MSLRFSATAWKKLHAALNTLPHREIRAFVEQYFHARGWTVVAFDPTYGLLLSSLRQASSFVEETYTDIEIAPQYPCSGLSLQRRQFGATHPYGSSHLHYTPHASVRLHTVERLDVLFRPYGGRPWNEQPVYAVRLVPVDDDILAVVRLAELPRNAEEPKPLVSVAQSLVKRLSNCLRALPVEHLSESGSQTGAGACVEMPLNPHGSGHEAGSRQNAPSQSPTGDCDGVESPPPQDGSPDAICANSVAWATAVGRDNPAGSGSDAAEQAAADAAERAEPYTDADDAAQDAPPFCAEATSGVALSNLSEAADEASRESSTVPSAGVAYAENAAVRQLRRNLLREYARRTAQPSTQSNRAFGGQFATIENRRPDARLVRELRRIFAEIMHGGEIEPSAHWDAARVALKTAGYLRSWTTHDRRLESGRPAMLVLADVSGSMNAFAEAVVALASAAAQLGVSGADVVVVVHANGYPLELQVNAQRVQRVPDMDDDAVLRFYEQLLRRYAIRAVITAADWDGAWLYHWLAEQPSIERVFWLDVYCSSYGDPRVREFPPRWLDESDAAVWRPVAHKVRYADRCNTAQDFVDALRLLIR